MKSQAEVCQLRNRNSSNYSRSELRLLETYAVITLLSFWKTKWDAKLFQGDDADPQSLKKKVALIVGGRLVGVFPRTGNAGYRPEMKKSDRSSPPPVSFHPRRRNGILANELLSI
ncbi:hypothetical protein EVAR_31651_1 [Eumeta japonica]|uniref:Uncharacterized protein n=1 Tax=Eumeta variegata TaxID=151549 RepID=A0A4C1W258_EUMVA|nr:hypothetical protein EVAR_31651_1 [Eumeta japonica]